jgi:hypothetical protein
MRVTSERFFCRWIVDSTRDMADFFIELDGPVIDDIKFAIAIPVVEQAALP